jgi:hypothetical protein
MAASSTFEDTLTALWAVAAWLSSRSTARIGEETKSASPTNNKDKALQYFLRILVIFDGPFPSRPRAQAVTNVPPPSLIQATSGSQSRWDSLAHGDTFSEYTISNPDIKGLTQVEHL